MKSKLLILSGFLTLFFVSVNAENFNGSGKIISRVINVADFNSVVLASSANVEISNSNTFSVVLTDYENLIDLHKFTKENSTLTIGTKPNTSIRNSVAKIKITVPGAFFSVKISGSGDVKINNLNTIKELSISGSGNISALTHESYQDIKLHISGSGRIKLNGVANSTIVSVSGSGELYLDDLKSQTVDCKLSGSGKANVFAVKKLIVSLTGSGIIVYSGNPEIEKNIKGSGKLIRK